MDRFFNTLRHFLPRSQPAIYVGAAMTAAIWVGINFQLSVEHDRSLAAARQNTENLARVFEEDIARVLTETDRVMRLLRASYQANGNFDLVRSTADLSPQGGLLTEIRIIGRDGAVIASSSKSDIPRANSADRDYFLVHQDSTSDELFISRPIFGRTSGIWLLQVSRPIRGADGSFQGVIVASLDPRYLAKFYHSINIGREGAIFVAGLDGIVRASAGFRNDVIGGSMLASQLFRSLKKADTGSFLTQGNQDGVKRFISYRVVKGYPLVVYVGQAQEEVLANYRRYHSLYFAFADAATALILFVICLAVRYRGKLNAAQTALKTSEANARDKSRQLELTLEHMNQGIMMVDADRNVMVMNRRAIDLLGLPEEYFGKPMKLAEIISYLHGKGEFTLDPSARAAKRGEGVAAYERARPNGTTLEIHTMALPDGGAVRTISDVSERKRKESQIAHMARHDALTNLANRTLFNERIERALSRMRHVNEGFALFYLDLDRFKAVNDAHGHLAGDALLRCVAERLNACIREGDTLARLGGDEFAILQSAAERDEDVEVLAQRVLGAVAAPYFFEGYHATVGISIGIATAPADGVDRESLFRAADAALYRAKSEGGNAYHFHRQGTDLVAAPVRLRPAANL
ncbi:MAG TPA: diguanylate cyclase [Xanthobacteraceae bacterium]|nr:diguanylate cyclase [Xanthobacteraceae bacterium]